MSDDQHERSRSCPERDALRQVYDALCQAQDCIRGETPEDISDEAAREDTIDKVRDAMRAVEAMQSRGAAQCAWKPIETAPKIYRLRILVFRPDAKRYPVIGEDYWSDIYQQGCWAMSPSDEQPTHWMPLPAAPSVSSTEGK